MSSISRQRSRTANLMMGNVLAFIFMVVMNFLANYLPLNNITTAEISDRYYNVFTPAGFTFIIWGVIYIALALLVIYLVWGAIKGKEGPIQTTFDIGWYFAVSSVLNGVWIFTWHYDLIVLSLVVMVALLLSLILLYRRLRNGEVGGSGYLLPFSIYLGWISVATIANVATLTVKFDWGGFGLSQEFWFSVVLVVIIALAAYMILKIRDSVYGLVILWALAGITVARWGEAGGLSYVAGATIGAAVIVFLTLTKKQFSPNR
ncbi:MAG: TspO/MBR family protein [Candidatus Bipolaricaulota bacterium]